MCVFGYQCGAETSRRGWTFDGLWWIDLLSAVLAWFLREIWEGDYPLSDKGESPEDLGTGQSDRPPPLTLHSPPCLTELALFSPRAAAMLSVSDIQNQSARELKRSYKNL